MAHMFWAVCFPILVLFTVTYSQDSALTEPSPHHRGHRHHHHQHHHPSETLTAVDTAGNRRGLEQVTEEEDDVRKDVGLSKVERGEDDGIRRGSDDAKMTGGLQDSWSTPPASPPNTPRHVSLTSQQSPRDGPPKHKRQHSKTPEFQNHGFPDGHLVSPAHGPYRAEHHSDVGLPGQDSRLSAELQPRNSSKRTAGINRIDSKDKKPRGGFPGPFESRQTPFFSKVPKLTAVLSNSSTVMKPHRKLRKKRPRRTHVNRPSWLFRLDQPEGGEEEKQDESRWRTQPHHRQASEQTGSSDRLRAQLANVSEIDHNQTIDKAELNAGPVEPKDTEKQKKRDIQRRGVSGKPDSPKGRRKKNRQGRRPQRKECVGCTKVEASIAEARELHKQILKAQLLDKLRLVPTLSERPLPPKLPEQVFPDLPQQDEPDPPEDQYYARPTQLLVFGRDLGKHRLRKPGTGSYKFEVLGKVKGEVTQADLWVYKMHDARDRQGQTLVVTQLQHGKGRRLRERSLVARLDTDVQEGWVRFDVTRLVQRWLASGRMSASSQMLAVRCKTCHRSSYRAIFGVKSNFRPVLVIREGRHPPQDSPRDKRNSQCDPNSRCCKFDLSVRFHDLGIHEIFYPKTIRTGYCYGTCERPDLHYHNHTMIIQRLRFGSYQPVDETLRERLRPCCVPVVLREASVMHYVNDGLDTEVSLIPNLLVDKCGCA